MLTDSQFPYSFSYGYNTTRECRQVSSIARLIRVGSNTLKAHWMVIHHGYSHPHAMYGWFRTHHQCHHGSGQWSPLLKALANARNNNIYGLLSLERQHIAALKYDDNIIATSNFDKKPILQPKHCLNKERDLLEAVRVPYERTYLWLSYRVWLPFGGNPVRRGDLHNCPRKTYLHRLATRSSHPMLPKF